MQGMVGLMKTDYEIEDLSYERLEENVSGGGGGSFEATLEPSY